MSVVEQNGAQPFHLIASDKAISLNTGIADTTEWGAGMSADDDEKRRPGKRPRGYAQKLLARTQYAMVKARSPLNDAQLDVQYALGEYGVRRSSTDRKQVFEHARMRGKPLPEDVVRELSKDPTMEGIQEISHSPFWILLEKPPTSRLAARNMVERCLKQLNLMRLPLALEKLWLFNMRRAGSDLSLDVEEVGCNQLEKLIRDNPYSLDVLALVGALFREACLNFDLQTANYLGRRFWTLMQDFVSQSGFESLDGDLDKFVIARIIYDRPETDAQSEFNPFGPERLPGNPIGLLFPADDPEAKALQHWLKIEDQVRV